MMLTYPPRIALLALALVMAIGYLLFRRYVRLTFVILFLLMLIHDLPWQANFASGENQANSKGDLTLLSFNAKNDFEQRHQLARFCENNQVDILMLQEISAHKRQRFVTELPGYFFFWGDKEHSFEHDERRVFSCLVGIKKSLVDRDSVKVFTGITGYRTIAVDCQLQLGTPVPFRLVNVHCTKPVTIERGVPELVWQSASKAARHRTEKRDLDCWIEQQNDDRATIIAGDFNAPANSFNLRFKNMNHAHRQSGSGPHLTFPRSFPIIGIDHVLGSSKIEFLKCETVDLGFSDHCGQLVQLRIR